MFDDNATADDLRKVTELKKVKLYSDWIAGQWMWVYGSATNGESTCELQIESKYQNHMLQFMKDLENRGFIVQYDQDGNDFNMHISWKEQEIIE